MSRHRSVIEESPPDQGVTKRLALSWDGGVVSGHAHIELTDGDNVLHLDGSDPARAARFLTKAREALDRMAAMIAEETAKEPAR